MLGQQQSQKVKICKLSVMFCSPSCRFWHPWQVSLPFCHLKDFSIQGSFELNLWLTGLYLSLIRFQLVSLIAGILCCLLLILCQLINHRLLDFKREAKCLKRKEGRDFLKKNVTSFSCFLYRLIAVLFYWFVFQCSILLCNNVLWFLF